SLRHRPSGRPGPGRWSEPKAMTGVAIVIPMLNEAAGLPRVLRSLAALEPPPAEVLAVDGGSTDASVAIAEAAGLLVVRHETRGRAAAINRGVQEATAPIICVLHADTLLPDDAVAVMRRVLADPGTALAGFTPLLSGPDRVRWGTSFHNWIKTWYAPLLFRPQLFLRGVRLLFGRPRHVLPPRRFPGRRRLRPHAAGHGGGGFVHPLPPARPNPPRQPRGDHLRKLVGANLLDTQPIRRTAKKTAELGNRVDVGLLGCWREVANRHVVDHPSTQRGHLSHHRISCLMIGSGQPQSSQTGAASRQVHSPLAQAGSFNGQLEPVCDLVEVFDLKAKAAGGGAAAQGDPATAAGTAG